MTQLFFRFLLLTCLAAGIQPAQAQQYSYIYLQGDKQTPFYVKLEGEMLPRYGKNYCIIPKLVPGVIQVEILFQQNTYPAQQFRIKVPDNGFRSFLLSRNGTTFSLYDIRQQFYLPAGNKEEEDQLPAAVSALADVNYRQPATTTAVTIDNSTTNTTQKVRPPAEKKEPFLKPSVTPPATTTTGQPQFLDDIVLSNEHTTGATPDSAVPIATPENPSRPVTTQPTPDSVATSPSTTGNPATPPPATAGTALINSDCPQPLSDARFDGLYKKVLQQATEESRLGYLNNQLGNCFSTLQAKMLAKTMDSDAARYSFLKKVYSRVTDQAAFGQLAELFSNDQWKTHFQQLLAN